MNPNRRRGYSLVEVVAVLGVSTVIAGTAVWLVHVSMQKSRNGQKHLEVHNTLARLADTFRGDAHAAVAIAKETAGKQSNEADCSTWLMTLASGGAIRYRLEPGRLIRSEFAALPSEDEASQKPLNQDSYTLPANYIASIELQPTAEPRIATIFVTRADADAKTQTAVNGPLIDRQRIDAAVSTDTRFNKVSTRPNTKTPAAKETKK